MSAVSSSNGIGGTVLSDSTMQSVSWAPLGSPLATITGEVEVGTSKEGDVGVCREFINQ